MPGHTSTAAAVASLLACAILASACLQLPDPSTEQVSDQASEPTEHIGEAPQANVYVGGPYGAADFPFKVEKKWDGKDKAGGRQRADKLFVFVLRDLETRQVTYRWTCPIDVVIPVQTEMEGYVSPRQAALVTADVANIAVPTVSHSRADWKGLSALFCTTLKDKMNDVFDDKYESYGARVTQWLQ
jgi:hypothetical protein